MNASYYHGDALERLKEIPDETYTAILTDPPYGLGKDPDMNEVLAHWLNGDDYKASGSGFKGETWDSFVPGPSVWKELYRTAKPGAFMLVYCGTRTADIMGVSIRLGGWTKRDEIEVHGPIDQFSWIYSTAMPKSLNISKLADKQAGEAGEVVESYDIPDHRNGHGRAYGSSMFAREETGTMQHVVRKPVSETAKTWHGYGTALNPSHEVIMVFRKPSPYDFLTTAKLYGTGVLNIDAARIPTYGKDKEQHLKEWDRLQSEAANNSVAMNKGLEAIDLSSYKKDGRWPKNTLFYCCDGEVEDCECPLRQLDAQSPASKSVRANRGAGINGNLFKSPDYKSEVRGFNDEGSKSRFFYIDKSSRLERDMGLDGPCNHPTVKPISLSSYLAKMVCPPDVYLDDAVIAIPFSGVGSEAIGAALAGWRNIHLFEQNEDYLAMSRKRMAWWMHHATELKTSDVKTILKNGAKK